MFLRKLANHIQSQNWTAVILDFVIVVIGVFMGLQFSNWNETRSERADERQILDRLHEETLDLIERRATEKSWRTELSEEMNTARRIIFGAIDADDLTESQCVSLYSSIFQPAISDGLPAIDDLINTGRMTILRDESLRLTVAQFLQARDDVRRDLEEIRSYAVYIVSKHPDLFEPRLADREINGAGITSMSCKLDAMRNDKGFLIDMSASVDSYIEHMRIGFGRLDPIIDSLHTQLDDELNISHTDDSNDSP